MDALQQALLSALDEVTPQLPALAERLAEGEDAERAGDERATEQFLRAFLALLREGIEGGREQRELVMHTAVPALVAAGQTGPDMVRSHVAFYMALAPLLVAEVPEALREEATHWLADYAADYTVEVLTIAMAQ